MRSRYLIILLLFPFLSHGQFSTNASKSELGFLLGGSYYIGDMNRYYHFNNTHLSGGVVYRYSINPRVSFRANVLYGKISGDDSESNNEIQLERNQNFKSLLFEGAAGVELNYLPFQIGNDRYNMTSYLLAQLGAFRMNPKTEYEGNEYELQPLGTEGQGTSYSNRRHYSLIQFCMPLGVGFRIGLGDKASLNFEFSTRMTFTDYLDDIRSDSYADFEVLSVENGPLAAQLSNRSVSGSRYGQRGNSSTIDWYFFSGIGLTFKLGKEKICMPWK